MRLLYSRRMKASFIDFKTYCAVLRAITVKQGKHNFELGDWLNDGEVNFGKKVFTVAARVTGSPVSSLRRIAGVAKQVPRSVRDKKLSWGYHQLVQSLSPNQQRTLLAEAEVDSTLSVHGFRRKVGFLYPDKLKSKRKVPYRRFCFSIPEDQFLLLEKLAEAKELTLTDYIAQVVAQHVSSPWAHAALIDAKATRRHAFAGKQKEGTEALGDFNASQHRKSSGRIAYETVWFRLCRRSGLRQDMAKAQWWKTVSTCFCAEKRFDIQRPLRRLNR